MKKPDIILKLEDQLGVEFEDDLDLFGEKDTSYLVNRNGNITNLSIRNLQLKDISFIRELKELDTLSLSNNQIVDISSLKELKELNTLLLSNNQIVDISSLKELKELDTLFLNNNKIPDIKPLKKNKNIEELNISGNPVSIPKQFEITNFKMFEYLKLENLSKDINIIIGKNGTGKTTLLQSLTFSLIKKNNKDIDTRTLDRYISKKREKEGSSKKEILKQQSEEEKEKTILSAYFSEEIKTKLKIGANLETNYLRNSNLLLAYGSNLLYSTEISKTDVIKALIDTAETYSVFSLFPDFNHNDYSLKFADPTIVLSELERTEKPELELVFNFLLKTLNSFLAIQQVESFEIVRGFGGYFYQNKKTKENFNLTELSEGYRSNILLVGDILIRILSMRNSISGNTKDIFKNVYGTILIDEFDKHLHPKWQRLFVQKLKETLPNIQFFLTTHNPVSLQAAEGETVIILDKNDKGEVIANVEKIPFGNSLEIVNNYYFDGQIYGTQTEEDISELNELKKAVLINKTEQDLIRYKQKVSGLHKKDLSEDFSALIDYDISYLQDFIEKRKNAKDK